MVRLMMMGGSRKGFTRKSSGEANDDDGDEVGGGGGGDGHQRTSSLGAAAAKQRKRLNPSARNSIDRHSSSSASSSQFPMYQYAINEYAQTVAAGTSNDAGGVLFFGGSSNNNDVDVEDDNGNADGGGMARHSSSGSGSWTSTEGGYDEIHDEGRYYLYINDAERQRQLHEQRGSLGGVVSSASNDNDSLQAHPPSSPPPLHQLSTGSLDAPLQGAMSSDVLSSQGSAAAASKHHHHHKHHQQQRHHSQQFYPSVPSPYPHPHLLHPIRSQFEAGMPDATYEESYGEAYTGGPIKYVYPSGYQSMRPRSCPWKISILVCLLFTWLSIFIVGHCSGQVAAMNDEYGGSGAADYAGAVADDEHDDKEVVLQTRWCGSRPLYLLWVTSMLITGLAAAYCSVIGYIKVRDFAVGNVRSQPPGVVVTGKSDYYVRIGDDDLSGRDGAFRPGGGGPAASSSYRAAAMGGGGGGSSSVVGSDATSGGGSGYNYHIYRQSIYQSDGTPQFWGAHIYRPTQAAVAVTSR